MPSSIDILSPNRIVHVCLRSFRSAGPSDIRVGSEYLAADRTTHKHTGSHTSAWLIRPIRGVGETQELRDCRSRGQARFDRKFKVG